MTSPTCAICEDDISAATPIVLIPCSHSAACQKCIVSWLLQNRRPAFQRCPFCRAQIEALSVNGVLKYPADVIEGNREDGKRITQRLRELLLLTRRLRMHRSELTEWYGTFDTAEGREEARIKRERIAADVATLERALEIIK